MIDRNTLEAALDPVFLSIQTIGTDLRGNGGTKAEAQTYTFYEAYLYALVLKAVQSANMSPRAEPKTQIFKFRRAPGEIYTTPYNFSYTIISSQSEYELHGDTKVASKFNGTPLEVDVLILTRAQANQCRGKKSRPSYRTLRLILESKFHQGGIGMTEAKSYLAICNGVRCSRCFDSLVSDGQITPDAQRLLGGYRPPLKSSPNVSPLIVHSNNVSQFLNNMIVRLQATL